MGGRKRREGKKYDVFISYSQADRKIADELCAHLEARGLACWIAPRNILSGERWAKVFLQPQNGENCKVKMEVTVHHPLPSGGGHW